MTSDACSDETNSWRKLRSARYALRWGSYFFEYKSSESILGTEASDMRATTLLVLQLLVDSIVLGKQCVKCESRRTTGSMLDDFVLYTKYAFGAYMPLCSNPLGNTLVSEVCRL